MNNGTEASLQDHIHQAGGTWRALTRAAILALAVLALVVPFTAQVVTASGPAAPALAPQQAEDDGENGQDAQEAEGDDATGEEDSNERFYIIFGVLAFVLLAVVGILFAVFGYVGSGR